VSLTGENMRFMGKLLWNQTKQALKKKNSIQQWDTEHGDMAKNIALKKEIRP